MSKKITDEQKADVVRLYNAGKKKTEIEKETCISYTTITNILDETGVKKKKKIEKTEELKESIIKSFKAIGSGYKVAEMYGVSFYTVKDILIERGIDWRSRDHIYIDKGKIRALHNAHWSLYLIADEMQLKPEEIAKVLKETS